MHVFGDGITHSTVPHSTMVALLLGLPLSLPRPWRSYTVSLPSRSLPKTVCLPSSQGQGTKVMKNCEPLVLGPALAMESRKGTSCLSLKFSSAKVRPQIDLPPVPLWFVKSPPCAMKLVITRWKCESLYPNPFSPVHNARKLAAVLGVTPSKRLNTSRPVLPAPKSTFKNTFLSTLIDQIIINPNQIQFEAVGRWGEVDGRQLRLWQ